MATLTIELPDEVYATLQRSPREVQREVRLAAAIRWYAAGRLSQERAAEIAGLDRTDFLMALGREKVDAFHVDFGALAREIEVGNRALDAGSDRARFRAKTEAGLDDLLGRGGFVDPFEATPLK
jgi:predicted HTH domain antitoxin